MEEHNHRVNKLIEKLHNNNIDAAIFFEQANIRYFTNFPVNQSTESVLIIESDGRTTYLVPRLDLHRAERDCWINNIHSFLEDTPDYLAPLRNLVKNNWDKVGVEKSSISLNHMSYINDIFDGEIMSIDSIISQQRLIKSKQEIDQLRKAADIATLTMNKAKEYILKNDRVTEREVTGYAKYIMDKYGAENYSFEPFIMSGLDSALPRRVSTTKQLVEGELILFDMGAIYNGYCSDITRTFCLGKASTKQKEIFHIALEAQERAIKVIKPGIMASEVDKVARDYIIKHGYRNYFPHLTGHGLGVGLHEYPIIDQGEESILQEGMVVTIEPGIYVPSIGAARIEDMILVTKNGFEYLTSSSRDLILN